MRTLNRANAKPRGISSGSLWFPAQREINFRSASGETESIRYDKRRGVAWDYTPSTHTHTLTPTDVNNRTHALFHLHLTKRQLNLVFILPHTLTYESLSLTVSLDPGLLSLTGQSWSRQQTEFLVLWFLHYWQVSSLFSCPRSPSFSRAKLTWNNDLRELRRAHHRVSGSSSTTRCWTAFHPWRSRRSWRGASCTSRTCPGTRRSALIGPAAGQSSCPVYWTSNPASPCRWAECSCRSLEGIKFQR